MSDLKNSFADVPDIGSVKKALNSLKAIARKN